MPSDVNLGVSLEPVIDPASLNSLKAAIKSQTTAAINEAIKEGFKNINVGDGNTSTNNKGTRKSSKKNAQPKVDFTSASKLIGQYYRTALSRGKLDSNSKEYEAQTNKLKLLSDRASNALKVTNDRFSDFFHILESGNFDELENVIGKEIPENFRKAFQQAYEDFQRGLDAYNAKQKDKTDRNNEKNKQKLDLVSNQEKSEFAAKALDRTSVAVIAGLGIAAKGIYNNVVELDKSIVDLQIATGKSYDEVARMMKGYSQLGRELGASTSDVAKAADSWLRQGYSVSEANELVTASMVLSKLGQIESSEATTYLTSAMKGYGYEASRVMEIVDKLTAVDLVSATSAGDLAEAMQKTSVTANQMGVSLDMLIGMIATVSEVSQQSSSVVGTAMKSMFARMTAIKAGQLVDPETEEDLSNVESALKGVGIQLRDSNSSFRDMDDVLADVASKWDTLSSVNQAAVASALGGVRQQESVRILMEYWDQVVSLSNTAANSTGSALEKFEAYTSGIEGSVDSLRAAAQNLSQTMMNTDAIKGTISLLTGVINALTGITEILGGGTTAGVIGSLGLLIAGFLKVASVSVTAQAAIAASTGAAISLKTAFIGAAGAVSGFIGPLAIMLGLLAAIGAIRYFSDTESRLLDSIEDYEKSLEDVREQEEKIKSIEHQIAEAEDRKANASGAELNAIETQINVLKNRLDLEREITKEIKDRADAEREDLVVRAKKAFNNVMDDSIFTDLLLTDNTGGIQNYILGTDLVDELSGLIANKNLTDDEKTELSNLMHIFNNNASDWVSSLYSLYDQKDYLGFDDAKTIAGLLDKIDFINTGMYGNRVGGDYFTYKPALNPQYNSTTQSSDESGNEWWRYDNVRPISAINNEEYGIEYSRGSYAPEFTEESLDNLIQKYPQLTEQVNAYKNALIDASELQQAINDLEHEFDVAETTDKITDALNMLDEAVTQDDYTEAIDELSDALGGLDLSELEDGAETVRDALEGDEEAFRALQEAAADQIVVSAKGVIDTSQLMSGLVSVQQLCKETGLSAEEVGKLLVDTGLFTVERKQMTGRFPIIDAANGRFGGYKELSYYQDILKPTEGNPFGGKRSGGGGKKGGNKGSSGKKSIISETFTKNQDMFKTQLDNLKSLNNLYEEGSDKWLKNQQSIIETYQAYAAIVEEEYNRLIKAGHKVSDEEVQKIAKEMIKVNEDLYKSAEEYWEAVRENRIDELQHMADQIDSVIALKEARHELVEEIKAETRALENEYEMARDLAANPGLTDLEREALFSTEDYEKLTGELQKIAKEADEMYVDYLKQIESISEDATDQLEFITNEFERQYELKLKEYEVAKANLAVTKAQKELENVRNQRTVAMLVGGVWTWVADSDAVQDAMENLADAEQDLADAESERDFNDEISQLEQLRDSYESEIAALEALTFSIDDLADHVLELTKSFNNSVLGQLSTSAKDYLGKFTGNGLDLFDEELAEIANGGYGSITFENENVQKLWDSIGKVYGYTGSKPELSNLVKSGAFDPSILAASGATYVDNRVYIDGIQLNDEQSDAFIRAIELLSYTYKP